MFPDEVQFYVSSGDQPIPETFDLGICKRKFDAFRKEKVIEGNENPFYISDQSLSNSGARRDRARNVATRLNNIVKFDHWKVSFELARDTDPEAFRKLVERLNDEPAVGRLESMLPDRRYLYLRDPSKDNGPPEVNPAIVTNAEEAAAVRRGEFKVQRDDRYETFVRASEKDVERRLKLSPPPGANEGFYSLVALDSRGYITLDPYFKLAGLEESLDKTRIDHFDIPFTRDEEVRLWLLYASDRPFWTDPWSTTRQDYRDDQRRLLVKPRAGGYFLDPAEFTWLVEDFASRPVDSRWMDRVTVKPASENI